MELNEDELELLELIGKLQPYETMHIAVNQNGTRLSVTIKNNRVWAKEFRVNRLPKESFMKQD